MEKYENLIRASRHVMVASLISSMILLVALFEGAAQRVHQFLYISFVITTSWLLISAGFAAAICFFKKAPDSNQFNAVICLLVGGVINLMSALQWDFVTRQSIVFLVVFFIIEILAKVNINFAYSKISEKP